MTDDVTPPTPDEAAGIRERHDATCWCRDDTHLAPMCDTARLLALVEVLRTQVEETAQRALNDYAIRQDTKRKWHRAELRLHAVLAECDRLDEDPGEVGPYTLVADRIRRAATGEGL